MNVTVFIFVIACFAYASFVGFYTGNFSAGAGWLSALVFYTINFISYIYNKRAINMILADGIITEYKKNIEKL